MTQNTEIRQYKCNVYEGTLRNPLWRENVRIVFKLPSTLIADFTAMIAVLSGTQHITTDVSKTGILVRGREFFSDTCSTKRTFQRLMETICVDLVWVLQITLSVPKSYRRDPMFDLRCSDAIFYSITAVTDVYN